MQAHIYLILFIFFVHMHELIVVVFLPFFVFIFLHFIYFVFFFTQNPTSVKDITASWLTSSLHDSGNLGSHIDITKLTISDIEGNLFRRENVEFSNQKNR